MAASTQAPLTTSGSASPVRSSRAPIAAPANINTTVIDLAFLARRRGDPRVRVRRALAAELHHEAPHARIPGREAVLIDEVLPDRHGVATAAESQLDELAVRRAGTRGRGPVVRRRPRR